MESKLLYSEITESILSRFFHVYNILGYGFLEKVYENALALTLRKTGRSVSQQVPIKVFFEETLVGDYFTDIIVDNAVVVEVKAAEGLHDVHEAQLLNYLKATDLEVGLLLNFGEKPQFKRRIFTNDLK